MKQPTKAMMESKTESPSNSVEQKETQDIAHQSESKTVFDNSSLNQNKQDTKQPLAESINSTKPLAKQSSQTENIMQQNTKMINPTEKQSQVLTEKPSQQSLTIAQPGYSTTTTQRPFNNTAPFALTITSQGMSNQTTASHSISDNDFD